METKQCQNCKKDFNIEEEDFDFYERLENLNEELEKLNIDARGWRRG